MTVATLTRPAGGMRAWLPVDQAARGFRDASPGTPIPFTASTSDLARDGMRLRPNGWRLTNYRRNPILLWQHRADQLPIGTTSGIEAGATLRGRAHFDQDDPDARRIEAKYRNGTLRSFSVKWEFVDGDGVPLPGRKIVSRWDLEHKYFYELVEVSGVTIPGDVGAVSDFELTELAELNRSMQSRTVIDLAPRRNPQHSMAARRLINAVDRYSYQLRRTDGATRPGPTTVDRAAADQLLDAFSR